MMHPAFTKILLAVDGAEDARIAAHAARDLVQRSGAELHIAHVWSLGTSVAYSYAVVPVDYMDVYEDQARAVLADETRRISADGGRVPYQHLLEGQTVDQILNLSDEIGADLIVMGSRGHGTLKRLVLGSTAEGIVRNATCPVLVVRGDTKAWPPKRLIIGDDGSPEAEDATELAVQVASLVGASCLLVRVTPYLPFSAELDSNVRDELIRRTKEIVAEHAEDLRNRYCPRLETLATSGDAARVLVDLADTDPEAVLLVVGSRGLGRVARIRLGSVSNDVLHAAHSPVLIVPHERD